MEKNGKKMYGKALKINYVSLDNQNVSLLKSFYSGNSEIDKYFREVAINDTSSKSFMVLDNTNSCTYVIGAYTLCCSGYIIQSQNRYYIYPAVEIKYFAVAETYQDILYSSEYNDCLSGQILSVVISNIMNFTNNYCGANKIILYSVPSAVNFYTTAGFKKFDDFMLESNERYLEGCTPMYFDLDAY